MALDLVVGGFLGGSKVEGAVPILEALKWRFVRVQMRVEREFSKEIIDTPRLPMK